LYVNLVSSNLYADSLTGIYALNRVRVSAREASEKQNPHNKYTLGNTIYTR
jgi:hypothetical protein